MKLADWLFEQNLTPEQLRVMLGVKNRSTIKRYLDGDRVPREDVLQKITEITHGRVTHKDILDPSPPRCAAVIIGDNDEARLVFPWSRDVSGQEQAFAEMLQGPREEDCLSNPVDEALRVLGARARFTDRGRFLLDGRPTDAQRVVRAANQLLRNRHEPLIAYPGSADGNTNGGTT